MTKRVKTISIIVVVLIILSVSFVVIRKKFFQTDAENNENNIENSYTTIDKENEIAYNESTGVNELKEATGATGDSNIYQVEEEYDGRKALVIKPSLQYQVVFAGMIKEDKPELSEIEEIYNTNIVQSQGIFVKKDSQSKFLEMLETCSNSSYYFDDQDMLQIREEIQPNENDEILKNVINSEKQYVIDIDGTCYIIDQMTGEVVNYDYEIMNPYQPYQYYQNENKIIMMITENIEGKLQDEEIIKSVIDLMAQI